MSLSDPIAELLTRIRNAARAKHRYVDVRYTKMRRGIVQLMLDSGFVEHFLVDESKGRMRIFLKYAEGRQPLVAQLVRISSPSLRRYIGYKDIPEIEGGMGLVVLSTPKGVLDGKTARKLKVGGELLCYIR